METKNQVIEIEIEIEMVDMDEIELGVPGDGWTQELEDEFESEFARHYGKKEGKSVIHRLLRLFKV